MSSDELRVLFDYEFAVKHGHAFVGLINRIFIDSLQRNCVAYCIIVSGSTMPFYVIEFVELEKQLLEPCARGFLNQVSYHRACWEP